MTENFKSYAVKILTEALTEVSTSIKNEAEERIFSPISRTSSSESYNPQEHSGSNLDTLATKSETNRFSNLAVSDRVIEEHTKKNNLIPTSFVESQENEESFVINANANAKTSQISYENNPDPVEALKTEETIPDEHQQNFTNASNTVSTNAAETTEYQETISSAAETIEKITVTRSNSYATSVKRIHSATATTQTPSTPNVLLNSSAIGTGIDQINSEDDNIAAEVIADLITNVINKITEEEKEVADLSLISPSIIETVEDHVKAELQNHPGTSDAADGSEEELTLLEGLNEGEEPKSESLESADAVKLKRSSKIEMNQNDVISVTSRNEEKGNLINIEQGE